MYIMAEWCKEHGIDLTEDQIAASDFLSSRGQRFLCEFGYGNCVEKADELLLEECLLLAIEPESTMVQ